MVQRIWYTRQAGNVTDTFPVESQGPKAESLETLGEEAVVRAPGKGTHPTLLPRPALRVTLAFHVPSWPFLQTLLLHFLIF